MKAIVVADEKLVLAEVPDPDVREGHILIDVHATALNRADLLQRRGLYPAPPGETEILGLECSGIVASGPTRGARVMALLAGGGYAERVAVPERMALGIPENLSFEQAAAIPEAFLTAYEALFTLGRIEPNAWVLIHAAAGGVGSAAVQLAHQFGARIIATAGSDEKLERVRSFGADVLINYKNEDFVERVKTETDGQGVDVVLDFIGGGYWERHARCLAIGGRLIVIGVLGGASASVNLAEVLRRRYQILGLVMRSRPVAEKIAITQAFARSWLPRFSDDRLVPVIDSVMPLADAQLAHERMEQNANVGKIVLSVRPEAGAS